MIITVTTNPSIDRTIAVNSLTLGGVNRGDLNAIDPGGKGVNVSRALAVYGAKTHAVLICGDLGSQWFGKKLNALNIAHNIIKAEGITRSNITLQESNGAVTKINEPGFELTKEVLNELGYSLSHDPDPSNYPKGLELDKLAKELADLLYVVYGTAAAFGLPIDEVYREVHESNMSKLGEDGKPVYREDGKVLKPSGWTAPDVEGVLNKSHLEYICKIAQITL